MTKPVPGRISFDLSGRVALVTGAGRHVGRHIAGVLAAHNATVAVNDINPDRAWSVAAELRAQGGRAAAAPGDVTRPDEVAGMLERISADLGPVDVLVNNAGLPSAGLPIGPFAFSDPASWQPVIDLNLLAVLYCTHAVLAGMVKRGWGRVVVVSSDAGRSGEAQLAVYAAAKSAALGFVRSAAREVGRNGVTVNAVALGSMRSENPRGEDDRRRARLYPVGRLGAPDDVAPALLFLCSSEASWITGQTLSVDGGYLTI